MSFLLATPLFWTTLTIAAFALGQELYRRSHNHPLLQPMLVGMVILVALIELSGSSYQNYMAGGDYLNQMLAPVVVMLAVPMYAFLHAMRKEWLRIVVAVSLGSAVTISVAGGLTYWLLGDEIVAKTALTKSITTPIAVAVAEQLGGIAALAAAFVMVTGLLGAFLIPSLLKVTKLDAPQSMGVALGVCAHAIGTARALEEGQQQAAYAAMAMTLTGVLHAIVLPLLF